MPLNITQYEALAKAMYEIYEKAELSLIRSVAKRAMRGVDGPGWTEAKLAEVHAVKREIRNTIRGLRTTRSPLMEKLLGEVYRNSAKAFVTDAQRFAGAIGLTAIEPNARRVAAILAEADLQMNAMERVILRKANDAYLEIISKVSAKTASGAITTRVATKEAVQEFAKRGITAFIDKAGRKWEMTTYAEMATLTAIQKSSIEGYTDTMQDYGYDLAVISSAGGGSCIYCEMWEGVIVSVSGENPNYPSLNDAYGAGVFHPRCIHELSTYYDGIDRNTRDKPRVLTEESEGYTLRQQQRAMERQVRAWKREMAAAPDAESERYAYNKVREWQAKIRTHIATAKEILPRKYWREGGRQTLKQQQ